MKRTATALLVSSIIAAAFPIRGQAPSDEDVARRQFESGRAFARQGNFPEALKDFHAVADTHPASSVADNALLEIGRYYAEIAPDSAQAFAAADAILKKYPASESVPDAHLLIGRLAMARSRQAADLESAIASFERVTRLFPDSDAVPKALALAGEALRLTRRHADALERFRRVTLEYATSPSAAPAQLGIGMVLAAQGDPISAMEEFQRVRNRWPDSPEAAVALARASVLFRLYIRARAGTAYAYSPEAVGPPRLENVDALAVTRQNALYHAGPAGVGLLTPPTAIRPPAAVRPRGLLLDPAGDLVVVDGNTLRPVSGSPVPLLLARGGSPQPLEKIDGAVATSAGHWLVADQDARSIHRFSRDGKHLGQFAALRVQRLAIDEFDDVAGIDRETKGVVVFDPAGNILGRIPARGTGYDLPNAVDLAYDAFGHLYVLDRAALYVFGPPTAMARAQAPTRLIASLSEPEKSPGVFRRAAALAVDRFGAVFIFDDRTQRVQVYR